MKRIDDLESREVLGGYQAPRPSDDKGIFMPLPVSEHHRDLTARNPWQTVCLMGIFFRQRGTGIYRRANHRCKIGIIKGMHIGKCSIEQGKRADAKNKSNKVFQLLWILYTFQNLPSVSLYVDPDTDRD